MRLQPLIAALAISFIAAAVQAAAPPMTEHAQTVKPANASTTAPTPSTADQARLRAIRQYQHDLVSVVALRADPDYLLGAALLSMPFTDQPEGLDFDALSMRALKAPNVGPEISWARLAQCGGGNDCPNPDAFGALKRNAADNVAVWILAMDSAAAKHDADAEHAALKKAANARAYDDYYGTTLKDVANVLTVLPPLPDTFEGAHDGQPDSQAGVRTLVAVEGVNAHPRPNLEPLLQVCGKDATDKNPGIKADCLKLAHTLEWGSSPIARAVGLRITGELDPAAKAQTDMENRNLAWQVHSYSALIQRALTDEALAEPWLARARNGGTELSLILATLRANHIPTEAPPSFNATPAHVIPAMDWPGPSHRDVNQRAPASATSASH